MHGARTKVEFRRLLTIINAMPSDRFWPATELILGWYAVHNLTCRFQHISQTRPSVLQDLPSPCQAQLLCDPNGRQIQRVDLSHDFRQLEGHKSVL
ncbi:hypothetical protein BMD20_12395 [Burkholderia multivorans]|nr:hypothetical protein BMD20_12395 [Burkholderia multivorans]